MTCSGSAFGDLFESIDRRKLTRLHRLTAGVGVRAHAADRRGTPRRVDAVAVLVPRTGGIRFDLLQDVRPRAASTHLLHQLAGLRGEVVHVEVTSPSPCPGSPLSACRTRRCRRADRIRSAARNAGLP